MSTKIYNAYKFSGKPADLMKGFKAYRPLWHDFQLNRLVNLCLKKPEHLTDLTDKVREQTNKPFPTMFDLFDIRGNFVIYFFEKNIYFQSFLNSPNGEAIPDFKIVVRCKDYHYQDQTDPWWMYSDVKYPEQRKAKFEADWKERERVWNGIFETTSTPVEAGVTYDLISFLDRHYISQQVTAIVKERLNLKD